MGVKAAIAHGWLTMHSSGGYLTLTQAGAELFA
jgi:acyl dehydratase